MSADKIGPQHLARKAVLYVRQSAAHQVQHNRESQGLQYAMRDRLAQLGWSQTEVIDEDLGCSAAGGTIRAGFEPIYAHSLSGHPKAEWEPLSHHLDRVRDRSSAFADVFGWAQAGRAGGSLHDIGKCSSEFLDYITTAAGDGEAAPARGPDHSTAREGGHPNLSGRRCHVHGVYLSIAAYARGPG